MLLRDAVQRRGWFTSRCRGPPEFATPVPIMPGGDVLVFIDAEVAVHPALLYAIHEMPAFMNLPAIR